ncbi:MAG TPA: response regulator [bacterium]|jgi:DNA-binding NtrC family response regulator|nr:response regulator [bacterium]
MKKLLVVDDEAGIRESLSLALLDEFEVSTAASAEEALDQIGRSRPEVMVLDQSMPGLGGLGLLEKLGGQNVPGTVMLSGQVDVEMVRQAMHLGADDLLSKPFDVAELKRMLHQAAGHIRRDTATDLPLALRGARAVGQASAQTTPLPVRSRWLSRTMVAEAVSECRGDRELAAQRLGMNKAELDSVSEELLEQ